jgi:hypothetical protein
VDGDAVLDAAVVAVLGASVGAAELISRYRDAPGRALRCRAALGYVGLNLIAALAALALIHAFDWRFGFAANSAQLRWIRVLIAGFGSMALLRSSLLLIRVGNQDVSVGPAAFLSILLETTDREVDRQRGQARSSEVRSLVADIPWSRARAELPALCLGLMQNATLEEQTALAGAVRDIAAGDLDDDVRVYLVGLELLNFAGIGVLRGAVELLSAEAIRTGSETESST